VKESAPFIHIRLWALTWCTAGFTKGNQRKQKQFKQYRTAKQKLTNKENLVRFLHQGKPQL